MDYFTKNEWGKNQYQNLSDARSYQNLRLRSLVTCLLLGSCFTFLILSAWSMIGQLETKDTFVVILDPKESLVGRTSPRFLSYGLDSSLLRKMDQFPIADETFINLARYLSPAYVRIGGTSADCLTFNKTLSSNVEEIIDLVTGEDISNFSITDKDFLGLHDFAQQTGARMIFDLNVLIRRADGYWDSANAEEIILFAKGYDMELDWQLGNEPNSFPHSFNRRVTPAQLATDYITLREILDKSGYASSSIIGPEANHIGDHGGVNYVSDFLAYAGNSVTYVSWHQYYLDGHVAVLKDFINPAVFNSLATQIKSVADVISATGKQIYMWMSETSTAYGSGAPNLSDRFVAGFLWLDKLGYSAKAGVNVVTRQSFFGGHYALVSRDLTPNPDWWVSVAYKQFVSNKVLNLTISNNFGSVRMYAHCTPEVALIDRVPAVTLYGVNLNDTSVEVKIKVLPSFSNTNYRIFFYAFTADDLQSQWIRLNGETLKLQKDGKLPPYKQIILETDTVKLPPYSMVFMVLHGVDVPACAA